MVTMEAAVSILLGTMMAGIPVILSRTQRFGQRRLSPVAFLCAVAGCGVMIVGAGLEVGLIASISTLIALVSMYQRA